MADGTQTITFQVKFVSNRGRQPNIQSILRALRKAADTIAFESNNDIDWGHNEVNHIGTDDG